MGENFFWGEKFWGEIFLGEIFSGENFLGENFFDSRPPKETSGMFIEISIYSTGMLSLDSISGYTA